MRDAKSKALRGRQSFGGLTPSPNFTPSSPMRSLSFGGIGAVGNPGYVKQPQTSLSVNPATATVPGAVSPIKTQPSGFTLPQRSIVIDPRESGGFNNPIPGSLNDRYKSILGSKQGISGPMTKIPSYKKGGIVKKTGLALVHKGEKVIPKEKAKSEAIKMKKGEFVKEHKRLVKVLESGKGRKKEAEKQERELEEKE